jgi:hypothetical protein
MKQYITEKRADELAASARNHFDYYAFVFDLANAAIDDWIKSQGDVAELSEEEVSVLAGWEGNTLPLDLQIFARAIEQQVSAKYKARLAQCEAVLGQAREAYTEMAKDGWLSCGAEGLSDAQNKCLEAITAINELIGEKK